MEELDKEALVKAKRAEAIKKAQEAKAKKKEEAKVVQVKQEKEELEEKPHPVVDYVIDPDGVYEFTLNVDQKSRHIPPTAEVWDEHYKAIRKVRLTSTEQSPYVDDQDENAKTSASLIFKDRKLVLNGTQASAIKYLLSLDGISGKEKILPQNRTDKNLFSLRDFAKEKKAEQDRLEKVLDAQLIVKETSVDKLGVFLRSRLGVKIDELEVKARAYKLAEANPSAFIDHINDPIHDLKAKFQELVEKGTVVLDNGDVILTASKAVIHRYDPKTVRRVDEDVAKFILAQSEEAKTLKKVLGL